MNNILMKTVFISGYAQVPRGTKLSEDGSLVGVMLEIDRETHTIVNAECTFVTNLAKDYFSRLLVGMDFMNQLNEIIDRIKNNMYIPSINSIIVALRIAHQRYTDSIIKNKSLLHNDEGEL